MKPIPKFIGCIYCSESFDTSFEWKLHCWKKHWSKEYVEEHVSLEWNPSCRFGYWDEDWR